MTEKDNLHIRSNTFIILQLGGNHYHEYSPSVSASILFKVTNRFWLGPFYEYLLSPFKDKYPSVWVTNYSYPYTYGREETRTGPTDGNFDFGQNVIGLSGLFLTSKSDKEGCFYLGGGIGMYTGSLNRKPILDIPESKYSFKNSIGFHILSALRIPIVNKFGLLLSAKYHIVHRELDICESGHVSLEYNVYGGVTRECRGEVCTYYINEYSEYGLIKTTEIHDVGKISGTFNNLSIQGGIFVTIY